MDTLADSLEVISYLKEISVIATKSNLSKVALNRFFCNQFFAQILLSLFHTNNLDAIIQKEIELSLISEILFHCFTFDDGAFGVIHSQPVLNNLQNLNFYLGSQ